MFCCPSLPVRGLAQLQLLPCLSETSNVALGHRLPGFTEDTSASKSTTTNACLRHFAMGVAGGPLSSSFALRLLYLIAIVVIAP
ncbi:hypothetical protein OE88DRAFT_1654515 [Heliocybe sulcata]|uniref:Uncharacterized protein n=1 Tax=Heliocybe sulcata TaxID=5364 RepID=A0A5C3N877_9AGAM|nr:hypothetical protein OE88DRAFT_1654515 [Heliocybe sulcata]